MVDAYKYEDLYYVHNVDDDYQDGEPQSTLDDALEAAKDDALMDSSNKLVTHVMYRTIKRVIVETHVEDL